MAEKPVTGHLTSLERLKFREILNSTLLSIGVDVENSIAINGPGIGLKFWELKGFTTITAIEDQFDFDFVVGNDCVPIVSNGKFVIISR